MEYHFLQLKAMQFLKILICHIEYGTSWFPSSLSELVGNMIRVPYVEEIVVL